MAVQHAENFAAAVTPPQTPRRNQMSTAIYPSTPPQTSWKYGATIPVNTQMDSSEQLCRALDRGCVYQVQQVLDADPDAAWMPVSLDGLETPVCAAVRLRCDLKVFQLLIARGAKLNMGNRHGQNPLSVLASCHCVLEPDWDEKRHAMLDLLGFEPWGSPHRERHQCHNQELESEQEYKKMEDWILSVALVLMQAGCSITDKDSSGRTAKEVALDNGWPKLESLIQSCHDCKSCVMLKHLSSKNHSHDTLDFFRGLPDTCVCHLLEFVTAHPLQLVALTRVDM